MAVTGTRVIFCGERLRRVGDRKEGRSQDMGLDGGTEMRCRRRTFGDSVGFKRSGTVEGRYSWSHTILWGTPLSFFADRDASEWGSGDVVMSKTWCWQGVW